MSSLNPRLATPTDFPLLARLIQKQCSAPATQCIHSATGESADTIRDEIARWYETDEIMFVVIEKRGQIIAAAGCEFDINLGRGWLRGPFVIGADWEAAAQNVFETLIAKLSPEVTRLDAFLNIENTRGQQFYEELGFYEVSRAHVYTAANPGAASLPNLSNTAHTSLISDPYHVSFANLHDTVFPKTYYTGEEILGKLDDDHRVYVYSEGGEVLGYLYAVIEPEAEEGYVEFLGVREDARGCGIGGRLLRKALYWFFSERDMPQVGLTVADTNVDARGLYERSGFRLNYTGVNQRKESTDRKKT